VNAQLLKESDFNEKMRKTKCSKAVTVQRVCRIAQNEKEVREVLEKIWRSPEKSERILAKIAEKNREVYEFEKMLERNL